jgi:alanine racemase
MATELSNARANSKRRRNLVGVALVEEGIALRQAGINHPILCLTGVNRTRRRPCSLTTFSGCL